MNDLTKKALIEDFGLARWDDPKNKLLLMKPEHVDCLPRDFVLTDINGGKSKKSDIGPQIDTRLGYAAYGITDDQIEEILSILIEEKLRINYDS